VGVQINWTQGLFGLFPSFYLIFQNCPSLFDRVFPFFSSVFLLSFIFPVSSSIGGGSYGDVGHEEMRDLWRCLLGTGSEDAGAGQVSNGSRGLLWDGRLGCSRLGGGMGSGCVQRGDEGQQRRGALLPALD
jgi:hypothetical protein